jgi:PAS domain S-box-containing protein
MATSLGCGELDITDRKRALEALKESEERFKTIIENLPGGVFTHDFDGRLLLVNEAASKNTGYPTQELLSLNVSDIDSGGYTREDREKLWNSLNTGQALTIESNHTRKDRSRYPIEAHLNAIMLDKKPAILAIAFDISERKWAEEAMRRSEERFVNAFQYAPIGMVLVSTEGHLVKVNAVFCQMLGYSEQEILSKTAQEVTHPDDWRKDMLYVKQMLEGTIDSYQIEKRYFHKDGHSTWTLLGVSLLREQNNQHYFICHIVDIDKRKQAEEENRRFKAIADVAVYGKAISDLKGKLIYVNRFFANIHGYTPDELIGRHFSVFHSQEQIEDVDRILASMLRQGNFEPKEVWHCHKDGTQFPLLMSGVVINDENGNPQCLATAAIDMTAYHKAKHEYETLFREMLDGFALHDIICDRRWKADGLPLLGRQSSF